MLCCWSLLFHFHEEHIGWQSSGPGPPVGLSITVQLPSRHLKVQYPDYRRQMDQVLYHASSSMRTIAVRRQVEHQPHIVAQKVSTLSLVSWSGVCGNLKLAAVRSSWFEPANSSWLCLPTPCLSLHGWLCFVVLGALVFVCSPPPPGQPLLLTSPAVHPP